MDERKRKLTLIGLAVIGIIIIIGVIALIINHFTPSKERMKLSDYYKVSKEEFLILQENHLYESKGRVIDGVLYLDYETVTNLINHRFYWDANENILSYTTPTEVTKTSLGTNVYSTGKNESKTEYPIVKLEEDTVYIALDYVKLFSNVEYSYEESPNRLVLHCDWGTEFLYADATTDTVVRYEANIKSPILEDVKKDEKLIFVDTEEGSNSKFSKVMTPSGVIGYVRNKYIGDTYFKKLTNDYKEEEYTSIKKEQTINMVWHQMTKQAGNDSILTLLETTKGVNVISPTWFRIINDEGEFSSLASEQYVQRAHSKGIEVWALISDFGGEEKVDMEKVLSYTSKREKLVNSLLAEVIKYDIDGINIDFEKITSDSGPHYVQFLRELSVKCRKNGIVLSVDNYVPMPYTAFYDRKEQGEIVDYVITMAYDEHYAGSEESGSVASISYVKDAVTNILKEVPKEKVIMALPFYTRLWKEEGNGETLKISSDAYSMKAAEQLLADKGVTCEWNEEVGQYYGQYESEGTIFKIWMEEDRSYELKLQAIFKEKIAGVAAWKLGLEKPSIWNVVEKYVK